MNNGPSYHDEIDRLTNQLNDHMKNNRERECNELMNKILNNILITQSKQRLEPNTWCLNTNLGFKEGQVCLLAHWKAPVRMLAVVCKATSDLAIGVLPGLQYNLHRLELKKNKRSNGKSLTLVVSKLKASKLCTSRRGWYAIHLQTFNKYYTAVKSPSNIYEIREQDENALLRLYNIHVLGMTIRPKTFPRKAQDYGIEQFLIDQYPTPEWKASVLTQSLEYKNTEEEEDTEETLPFDHYNEKNSKLKLRFKRRKIFHQNYPLNKESQNINYQYVYTNEEINSFNENILIEDDTDKVKHRELNFCYINPCNKKSLITKNDFSMLKTLLNICPQNNIYQNENKNIPEILKGSGIIYNSDNEEEDSFNS